MPMPENVFNEPQAQSTVQNVLRNGYPSSLDISPTTDGSFVVFCMLDMKTEWWNKPECEGLIAVLSVPLPRNTPIR